MQGGASPKAVQGWLGHTDLRLTMNTYTHAHDSDLRDAAGRIGATLLP
jgi:integrase